MADEATTVETNLETANPTVVVDPTASSSSTIPATVEGEPVVEAPVVEAPAAEEAPADPLDAATILDKPEGEEGEKDKEGEGDEPVLIGAPEGDYELSGLPDGTVIDGDALDAATPLFRKLNLSNEGASQFARLYAEKVLPLAAKQTNEGFIGQVVAQRAEWDRETREKIGGGKDAEGKPVAADPIFGGKDFETVIAASGKAIDRFGGADFGSFLKETGLGNHPAMVRFAYLAGSAISEDTDFERQNGIPSTPKTREDKYYPKT